MAVSATGRLSEASGSGRPAMRRQIGGGLAPTKAKRPKGVGDDKSWLKKRPTDGMLDNAVPLGLVEKVVSPAAPGWTAVPPQATFVISERQDCPVLKGLSLSAIAIRKAGQISMLCGGDQSRPACQRRRHRCQTSCCTCPNNPVCSTRYPFMPAAVAACRSLGWSPIRKLRSISTGQQRTRSRIMPAPGLRQS